MSSKWRMTREIAEQPRVFEECIETWSDQAGELREAIADRDQLVVLGRGSSKNACVFASYLYGMRSGRQAAPFHLWMTTREDVPKSDWSDVAVLAFSASGQSTDIARAADWLGDRGAVVIGVTNADDERCALGEAADDLFFLDVGDERAVPATKTFNAQLFASASLVGFDIEEAVRQTATCFRALEDRTTASRLADFIDEGESVFWIARGPSLSAARDAALKLRECARLESTGWSSAEIQHGHIGSIDGDDRVVIFSDANQPAGSFSSVAKGLLGRKTPFVVAGLDYYRDDNGTPAPVLEIDLPEQRWARAPVFAYLSQQTALEIAIRRNLNPDCPAGLQKVTKTL